MKLKNNKRGRIYNHLFFRIYLYFGIVLLLFAVLLGFIFMNLYSKSIMEAHQESVLAQAEIISNRVTSLASREDKGGFDAYKEALYAAFSGTNDIWILSNPNVVTPMDARFTNVEIPDDMPAEVSDVLEHAFLGETAHNSGFDPIYEMIALRVGAPIYDMKGNVMGAVMVVSLLQSQKNVIEGGKSLVYISCIAALSVSFVIALLFTGRITKPISKMRNTALLMADGNYDIRVNNPQKDEMGDLAESLDILAERLMQNERERENMEQMRRDFFANVSHELRTPITVMLGYTEMLADGVVTQEDKKQQYYDRMRRECNSMERLVRDLLLLSKMQNPDFAIESEPVNLTQVFDEVVRSANIIAEKKSVKIHFNSQSGNSMLLGDYGRLRQMFLVIIDNAIKFSNEGGNIYINIAEEDKLKITIEDEGRGIAEEDLPFIFEKFYKSKLRQNAKGSGLGLMIARQIAIRHGGIIEVESLEGKGSIFYFFFDKIDPEML